MNCDFLENVYLMSNGAIGCGRDIPGNLYRVLPMKEGDVVSFESYVEQYQYVLNSMKQSQLPFQGCSSCKVLYPEEKAKGDCFDNSQIHVFVVEPTVLCNISCAFCTEKSKRKSLRDNVGFGDSCLDYDLYVGVLNFFKLHSVSIEVIEFQGYGEPLLGMKLVEMVEAARQIYPESQLSVITNGIKKIEESVLAVIDQVIFSIDGINQQTYEPYRRGVFCDAFDNMKRSIQIKKLTNSSFKVVWKYILFQHNSTTEDLQAAIDIARIEGVDELRFIISDFGPISEKFHMFGNQINELIFSRNNYCDQYTSIGVGDVNRAAVHMGIASPFSQLNFAGVNLTVFVLMTHNKSLYELLRLAKNCDDYEQVSRYLMSLSYLLARIYHDVNFSYVRPRHLDVLCEVLEIATKNKQREVFRALNSFCYNLVKTGKYITRGDCTFDLEFEIFQDIKTAKHGYYEVVGLDPILNLHFIDPVFMIGKFIVEIEIVYDGNPGQAQLFFDGGDSYSEINSVRIPGQSGLQRFVVESKTPVRALRYDPADQLCSFKFLKANVRGDARMLVSDCI